MERKSLQDQGSVAHCYGCGPDNPHGLRIKSYREGSEAVCTWQPEPYHCGGSPEIVYGGIIASLIDCHSVNLAIADAYEREGREVGSEPKIHYVTASLSVSYLLPTPLGPPLRLRARVIRSEGRKSWMSCTLEAEGKVRASAEVLAVRVQRPARPNPTR